jgi:hypothetical protein
MLAEFNVQRLDLARSALIDELTKSLSRRTYDVIIPDK